MKKKIVIISVIFVLLLTFFFDFSTHFTRVSAGKVEPVPYLILKWGDGENEMGLSGPHEDFWYDGPATFDVDKEGNVYIVDQLHNRIVKVDKTGKVIDSIDISKIISKNDPNAKYSPIQLIVADRCMFLLHVYSFDLPPLDPYSYPLRYASRYVSVITKSKIIKIDAQKLLGQPVDVRMDRLSGNKIVLTPSVPPEGLPTWKGPKAVIVNENGETRIVKRLVNGSFDGITPGVDLLFNRYKDTWLYENTRIEVKDPKTGKPLFLSKPLENGAPIDSLGLRFNSKKIVIMYQTPGSENEETKTVTTHITVFNLHPKTEENYTMVIGEEDRKNMLPPPFVYRVNFVLGEDGYFYNMLYTKDGLLISRFEPEVSTTTYQYRFIKFTKSFGKN